MARKAKLIPFSDIKDEARDIAVAWIDNFKPMGGIDIMQKHKLASDIMNYSNTEIIAFKKKLKAEIGKLIKERKEKGLLLSPQEIKSKLIDMIEI